MSNGQAVAVWLAQVQSMQCACLLLDEGLVGSQQVGKRTGVERPQGIAAAHLRLRRRGRRPLRRRLGHTHLLTCRQPHIRCQACCSCTQRVHKQKGKHHTCQE